MITSMASDPEAIVRRAMEHAKRVGVDGVVEGAPVVFVMEEQNTGSKVVRLVKVP